MRYVSWITSMAHVEAIPPPLQHHHQPPPSGQTCLRRTGLPPSSCKTKFGSQVMRECKPGLMEYHLEVRFLGSSSGGTTLGKNRITGRALRTRRGIDLG